MSGVVSRHSGRQGPLLHSFDSARPTEGISTQNTIPIHLKDMGLFDGVEILKAFRLKN